MRPLASQCKCIETERGYRSLRGNYSGGQKWDVQSKWTRTDPARPAIAKSIRMGS